MEEPKEPRVPRVPLNHFFECGLCENKIRLNGEYDKSLSGQARRDNSYHLYVCEECSNNPPFEKLFHCEACRHRSYLHDKKGNWYYYKHFKAEITELQKNKKECDWCKERRRREEEGEKDNGI
jgi:hypothetical protein